MSGCTHVCVKYWGPCVETLERVYRSPAVRVRARALGVRQRRVGAQRVLQGPERASGLFRGTRRPSSLGPRAGKRKRAVGWAAPLSAPPRAGSPAPLCDPRRCARGGGRGKGRGGGRGASSAPAPPSGPLAGRCRPLAGTEGSVGPRAPQREGPAGGPGTRYFPPPQPPPAPALPPGGPPAAPGQGPALPLPTGTSSQWWPWTPHLRAEARLGSPLATVCGSLLLPCFLASTLLASDPLERPPHVSGPQSLSGKWGQIAPSEMMPVSCDRQGLALGKARPKLLASVLVPCSGSTFSPRPTSPAPDVPAGGGGREAGRTSWGHSCRVSSSSLLALYPPTPISPTHTHTHNMIWGPLPAGVGLRARVFSLPKGADPVVSSLGDFRQRGLGPQRGRGDDTVVPPALRGGQHGSLQHGGSR